MHLREAKQSYILDCRARDLSQHTVRVYDQRLDHFLDFLEPRDIRDTAPAEQMADCYSTIRWIVLQIAIQRSLVNLDQLA